MNGIDAAVYGLRAMGALYILGGAWAGRAAFVRTGFGRPLAEIESLTAAWRRESILVRGVKIDPAQEWWQVLGCLLAILAGAAMLALSPAAPVLLAFVVLHHILLFAHRNDCSRGGARVGQEVSRRMAAGYFLTSLVAIYTAGVGALGQLG